MGIVRPTIQRRKLLLLPVRPIMKRNLKRLSKHGDAVAAAAPCDNVQAASPRFKVDYSGSSGVMISPGVRHINIIPFYSLMCDIWQPRSGGSLRGGGCMLCGNADSFEADEFSENEQSRIPAWQEEGFWPFVVCGPVRCHRSLGQSICGDVLWVKSSKEPCRENAAGLPRKPCIS